MKFLGRGITVILHGSLDLEGMSTGLRNVLRQADPSLAIREMKPLEQMVSESTAEPRFRTSLLAAFSGMALILAAIGIYGAMSYLVAQRLQEIGVRLALGAPRSAVVQMVVKRALALTVIGVGAGLILAALLVSTVRGLLFGVTTHDPVAFTVAPAVIIAIAVLASLAPAVRAARTDPLWSLRAE
jgi:ABC-type antimicrobial peptide transport system permease subunit